MAVRMREILAISKQTEQRARIGKIFARWHLVIAITSIMSRVYKYDIESEVRGIGAHDTTDTSYNLGQNC